VSEVFLQRVVDNGIQFAVVLFGEEYSALVEFLWDAHVEAAFEWCVSPAKRMTRFQRVMAEMMIVGVGQTADSSASLRNDKQRFAAE
jgi:hypothetical protein